MAAVAPPGQQKRPRKPRVKRSGGDDALRRCDQYLQSLKEAVLSPGYPSSAPLSAVPSPPSPPPKSPSHAGTPYFTAAAGGPPVSLELSSPGIEERLQRLQNEKAQLTETLRRVRLKQRKEVAELQSEIEILEEGRDFLLREVERAAPPPAAPVHPGSGVAPSILEMMEGLCLKQNALESEVRRMHGAAAAAAPQAHDAADVTTRAGIEWSRDGDAKLRMHQAFGRGPRGGSSRGGGSPKPDVAAPPHPGAAAAQILQQKLHAGMSPGQVAAVLRSFSPEASVTPRNTTTAALPAAESPEPSRPNLHAHAPSPPPLLPQAQHQHPSQTPLSHPPPPPPPPLPPSLPHYDATPHTPPTEPAHLPSAGALIERLRRPVGLAANPHLSAHVADKVRQHKDFLLQQMAGVDEVFDTCDEPPASAARSDSSEGSATAEGRGGDRGDECESPVSTRPASPHSTSPGALSAVGPLQQQQQPEDSRTVSPSRPPKRLQSTPLYR
eukprot:Rhum_TRINITY_DN460_c0_g1::Rhum_TRINITY_DN460_c0_g1_i1::g.1369::m.1369